ncbi:hypothetical protein OZ13_08880 [Xanthomonas cannabis pv. cannabis]|nr:hypothetical protein OZ13_08880 [Xanthomonas cannabis pv. cannabis]KHL56705.1 hypothetical protein OZ10_08305 [Xanthomonas cannabis pv. cannabis]
MGSAGLKDRPIKKHCRALNNAAGAQPTGTRAVTHARPLDAAFQPAVATGGGEARDNGAMRPVASRRRPP